MIFETHLSPWSLGNICVNMHQFWWFLYCLRLVAFFWTPLLGHLLIKQTSFCAHWKGNFLGRWKLVSLLSLVHCQRLKRSFTKKIPLFSLKRASYLLKGIYQMDHIWLATSRLNKSPDLKLGSQYFILFPKICERNCAVKR